jgi:acyl dehydratase
MRKLMPDAKIGAEFAGKRKTISEPRVLAFSGGRFGAPGWPAKNIHTDLEFAKSCGLQTRSVSGTQYMGYLIELMVDLFGETWLSQGKMELKFIAIVDVEDSLLAKAAVISKEPEGSATRFVLDMWCENQHGNKVAIGTAIGSISY